MLHLFPPSPLTRSYSTTFFAPAERHFREITHIPHLVTEITLSRITVALVAMLDPDYALNCG